MPMQRLRDYLGSEHVAFRTITHPRTITAQETAASAHIRGKELAKTVIVRCDGQLAMAVLPACERLHLGRLRQAIGARDVSLASEPDFRHRFDDCELGAMPPFGNLYGLDVFVSDSLAEDEVIAFNAGRHDELVQMGYRDFERLVQPLVVEITRH